LLIVVLFLFRYYWYISLNNK
jgi:hypothetical protein